MTVSVRGGAGPGPSTARAHMWAPACQPSAHTLPHIQQPRGGYSTLPNSPAATRQHPPPSPSLHASSNPWRFHPNTTPHTHPNTPTLPLSMFQLSVTTDCCTLLASRLLCTHCRVDCHICR